MTQQVVMSRASARAIMVPNSLTFTEARNGETTVAVGVIALDGPAALLAGIRDTDPRSTDPALADATLEAFSQLAPLMMRTLVLELNVARETGLLKGDTSEDRYSSFIRVLSSEAYQRYLFAKYPALGRLLREQYENLTDSYQTVARVGAIVRRRRGIAPAALNVVRFIGDAHQRGRQGAYIEYTDGLRLVVKPRLATYVQMYEQITEILNEHLAWPLRVAKSVTVDDWSVEEYIAPREEHAEDGRDAHQYGSWLALLHYTDATDMHFENFIMSSEGPVPIDLECALSPQVMRFSERSVLRVTDKLRAGREMLSRISLIPNPGVGSYAVHWSPLANRPNGVLYSHHVVSGDGTDRARLEFTPRDEIGTQFESDLIPTLMAADELERGFAEAQAVMAAHSDRIQLIVQAAIEEGLTRVVRKPTQLYADILRRAAHPRFLIDETLFEAELSNLIQASGDDPESGLGREEVASLGLGYIPFYDGPADERAAHGRMGIGVVTLDRSGAECVRDRLSELRSGQQLAMRQHELHQLVVGLYAQAVDLVPSGDVLQEQSRTGSTLLEVVLPEEAEVPQAGDPEGELVRAATGVIDSVIRARWSNNLTGEISWASLTDKGDGDFALMTTGYDLYNGLPGILCALLAHPMPTAEAREVIKAITESCLTSSQEWMAKSFRYSVYSGGLGAVYGLWNAEAHGYVPRSRLQNFTGQILHEAVEVLTGSEAWDMLSGSTGALLLVRRLSDIGAISDQVADSLAARLCDDLLSKSERDPVHPGLWWALGDTGELLGGVAHGVAGVQMAVGGWRGRIAHADDLYRETTIAQRSLRVGASRWLDRRVGIKGEALDAWCHGASGIILADDRSNDVVGPEDYSRWEANEFDSPNLTLCHGMAGALVTAQTVGANRARVLSLAGRLERAYISAEKSGVNATLLSESLFMGRSGVGYAFGIAKNGFDGVGNVFTLSLPQGR